MNLDVNLHDVFKKASRILYVGLHLMQSPEVLANVSLLLLIDATAAMRTGSN